MADHYTLTVESVNNTLTYLTSDDLVCKGHQVESVCLPHSIHPLEEVIECLSSVRYNYYNLLL